MENKNIFGKVLFEIKDTLFPIDINDTPQKKIKKKSVG